MGCQEASPIPAQPRRSPGACLVVLVFCVGPKSCHPVFLQQAQHACALCARRSPPAADEGSWRCRNAAARRQVRPAAHSGQVPAKGDHPASREGRQGWPVAFWSGGCLVSQQGRASSWPLGGSRRQWPGQAAPGLRSVKELAQRQPMPRTWRVLRPTPLFSHRLPGPARPAHHHLAPHAPLMKHRASPRQLQRGRLAAPPPSPRAAGAAQRTLHGAAASRLARRLRCREGGEEQEQAAEGGVEWEGEHAPKGPPPAAPPRPALSPQFSCHNLPYLQ